MLKESAEAPAEAAAKAPDPDFADVSWALAVKNFSWLVWGDQVVIPAMNDDASRVRVYCDSPRTLIFSIGPDPESGPGMFAVESDLRRDRLRAVARDPRASSAAVERKLRYGVLEGALEHELIAEEASFAGGSPLIAGTSSLAGRDPLTVLRPADASRAATLSSNPETAARLALALKGGSTVLAPPRELQGPEPA